MSNRVFLQQSLQIPDSPKTPLPLRASLEANNPINRIQVAYLERVQNQLDPFTTPLNGRNTIIISPNNRPRRRLLGRNLEAECFANPTQRRNISRNLLPELNNAAQTDPSTPPPALTSNNSPLLNAPRRLNNNAQRRRYTDIDSFPVFDANAHISKKQRKK